MAYKPHQQNIQHAKAIMEAADKITAYLKSKGVVIMRYDAYSSNSVYLKFDYGVCNSLRISDHQGKGHLSYRFNLLVNITDYTSDLSGQYPKYFYPLSQGNRLLKDILSLRQEKIQKYGAQRYQQYMVENMTKGKENEKGFWKEARIV